MVLTKIDMQVLAFHAEKFNYQQIIDNMSPQNNSAPLQWRHNEPDAVSNHQPHDCLLNRLFRSRSKIPWKLRVTGLCAGNWPATGEFPAQRVSNAENVSIWWRHHHIKGWLNFLSTTKQGGLSLIVLCVVCVWYRQLFWWWIYVNR